MKVIRIVLTGGPCAGKTTMLGVMKEYLDERGICSLYVPEAATDLIKGKFKPYGNFEEIMRFQNAVLRKQLGNEEQFMDYGKESFSEADLCVIIHDRGLLDNKAYLPETVDFQDMLKKYGKTEIDCLDSYDLVLDLISTAVCKPEVYGYNNETRYETLEEAVATDARTTKAWLGHRNLKIIPSYLELEDEEKIILDYLEEIMYNRQQKHVSSIEVDDVSLFEDVIASEETVNVCETKIDLNAFDGGDVIISKRTYKGADSYTMRIQKQDDDQITIYQDRIISEREYEWFLSSIANISTERKKEVQFIDDLKLYRLVFFDDSVVLETERTKYEEFVGEDNVLERAVQKVKSTREGSVACGNI